MSNGKFLVAEFSDGIQVIPKVWMCNNNILCKYPSHYKSDKKIRKAVEKEEKPNSDWPLFEIKRIFVFCEYSSLEKTDDKAERAIYTSDMDTEKETKSYRKFRTRKYSYSSSISAENETFLSDVPSPSRYSSKISQFGPKKRQQQDINKDEKDFTSSSENNTNFTKQSTTYKPCSSNVKNRNQHDKYSGASNKDRDEEDSINNSSHTYQFERRNSSTWNQQSSSPIIFNQLKKLTREVTVLKYDMRQALTSIDILVQKANEETRYRITDNSLEEVENLFPLKTTVALIEMEETLSNKDSELAKKITAYIRSIGGGNVDDAVKRCLRKTFTNELAQMYNWEGCCRKNALQNLHLIKVIFRCILQNITGSDHKQIQKRIMEWFRHSKARHSNEEKRQRRNQNDDGNI